MPVTPPDDLYLYVRCVSVSYTKQASRRSVCSDGVTDWLESQADDTCVKVDRGGEWSEAGTRGTTGPDDR